MTPALLGDLWIVLAAGLIAGLVCHWLRVSVLVGYLVVGGLLGQGGLGVVQDHHHQIENFAEAGVFLLLFSIGLEFAIDDLRRLGRELLIGGAVQMMLVIAPVVLILRWFDLAWQAAILIASAVAFSSTVLVFKGLSERGQAERPHGRRAIAVLLFQDAALVPLLLLVPLLTHGEDSAAATDYLRLSLISLTFVVAIVWLRSFLARRVIPMLAGYRRPELVVLFTAVALGGVTLAAYTVGLPPAVGAFAAGLIFNGNRWTQQIDSLVLPFRETFAAIFFVSLGLIFDPQLIIADPLASMAMLLLVILIKAAAATFALRATGLDWIASAAMGIGLAHIGEFAFVLILLGWEAGVVAEEDYLRLVSLAVGSLVLTPLLMPLGLRWIRSQTETEAWVGKRDPDRVEPAYATVIGAGPIGRQVASRLEISGRDVCLIDLSPINLHGFAVEGFRTIVGDAADPQLLVLAEADRASLQVVCVSNDDVAMRIVRSIRGLNRDSLLVVRCRFQSNRDRLLRLGADRVVSEESVASAALLDILAETL